MFSRLKNLKRAGFVPTKATDVGAFDGGWTRGCQRVWPGLPSIMVEPLDEKRPQLMRLASAVPGSHVFSNALGREEGDVVFRLAETNSGIVVGDSNGLETVTIHCRRL